MRWGWGVGYPSPALLVSGEGRGLSLVHPLCLGQPSLGGRGCCAILSGTPQAMECLGLLFPREFVP